MILKNILVFSSMCSTVLHARWCTAAPSVVHSKYVVSKSKLCKAARAFISFRYFPPHVDNFGFSPSFSSYLRFDTSSPTSTIQRRTTQTLTKIAKIAKKKEEKASLSMEDW